MRNRGRLHILVGWALALLFGAGGLGSAGAQEGDAPPLYQVEVIIFAYEDFDPAEELFALPPRMARSQIVVPARRQLSPEALQLAVLDEEAGFGGVLGRRPEAGADGLPAEPENAPGQAAGGNAAAPAPDIGADPRDALVELDQLPLRDLPFGVRRLSANELQLGGAFTTLNRLGAYTPLLHVGWVQEGLPDERAVAFDLSELGGVTPSGTISLYVTRFLRLGIDVAYQPRRRSGGRSATSIRDPFELSEITPLPRYRLVEDRRVRTGEIHYFDHPAFGMIATIRPQARPTSDAGVPRPAP